MDAVGISVFAALGLVAGWLAPRLAALIAEPRYGIGSDDYDEEDDALAPLGTFDGVGLRVASALLLGAGAAGLAYRYGRVAPVVVAFALAAAATVASLVDFRYLRLPDVLTYGSAVAGAVAVVLASLALGLDGTELRIGLVGAAIGGACYWGLLGGSALLFEAARGVSGLGLGDVKLALSLGLTLGWFGALQGGSWIDAIALLVWGVMAGFALGLVGGLAITSLQPGKAYPMGPFLALGWLVVLVYQPLR